MAHSPFGHSGARAPSRWSRPAAFPAPVGDNGMEGMQWAESWVRPRSLIPHLLALSALTACSTQPPTRWGPSRQGSEETATSLRGQCGKQSKTVPPHLMFYVFAVLTATWSGHIYLHVHYLSLRTSTSEPGCMLYKSCFYLVCQEKTAVLYIL